MVQRYQIIVYMLSVFYLYLSLKLSLSLSLFLYLPLKHGVGRWAAPSRRRIHAAVAARPQLVVSLFVVFVSVFVFVLVFAIEARRRKMGRRIHAAVARPHLISSTQLLSSSALLRRRSKLRRQTSCDTALR